MNNIFTSYEHISNDSMSLLQEYEARLIGESKTEATRELYLRVAVRMIEFSGGLDKLDEPKVLEFRDVLAAKVDQNSMVTYVHPINRFCEFLGLNVSLKTPKRIKRKKENLTKDEFLCLLRAADAQKERQKTKRDVAMLLLMGEGGARSGEVRDFKLKDLDLTSGYILARMPKGKHDRKIIFGEATKKALKEWLEVRAKAASCDSEPYLFLNQEGERILAKQTLGRMIAKLAAEAHIERRVYPHMLRRYRITELAMSGMNLWKLQAFAGHASITSTQEYVVVDEAEMMRQVQAIPAVIIEDAPKSVEPKNSEPLSALANRFANGEISETAFLRATTLLEKHPELEAMR